MVRYLVRAWALWSVWLMGACGGSRAPLVDDRVGELAGQLSGAADLKAPASLAPSTIARLRQPNAPVPPAPLSPIALTYGGGAVLTDVEVAIVYWGNVSSTLMSTLPGFMAAMTDSAYFDWLSEYNTPTRSICRGSTAGSFLITPSNTHTHLFQSEIEAELAHQIDAGAVDSDGDPLNGNRFYMIYFPSYISITDSTGADSCVAFCAFHQSFVHNGKMVRYAVMPDLSTSGCNNGCGPGSVLQNTESASSHELVEAVTDPDPFGGWNGPAGEIGDLCNQQETTLPGTSFTVQAMWSNALNTCVVTQPVPVSPPLITSMSPATGPYNVTTDVVLLGSCFSHPSITVSKGTQSAAGTIPSWSRGSPTAQLVTLPTSPDGAAGTGLVMFANGGATTSATTPFNYFYVGPLNVSLSPDWGPMQGLNAVNITGQGLLSGGYYNPTVTFGGVPSPNVWCSSSTSCVVAAPPHDPGTVQVVVSASGTSMPSANNYTYLGPVITLLTPNHGPITGGTGVDIHGENMVGTQLTTNLVASVTVGGINVGSTTCFREGSTDGSCGIAMPAGVFAPGTYDVRVTLDNITGTSETTPITLADKFTFTALPSLVQFRFDDPAVGGATVNGIVSLDGYAPSPAGATINLALAPGAPSNVVSFSSTVTVSASRTWADVPVTVIAQNFTGAVPIVATYGGTSATGVLNVSPTPPPTLSVPASCGGRTYLETVTLAEPAPPTGGNLVLSGTNVTVPSVVPVSAGSTTATFTMTTPAVTSSQTATVNVSWFGVAAAPATFQVLPNGTMALSVTPSSIVAGGTANGTIAACAASPPTSATLTSTSGVAGVPAAVSLSGGLGTFVVTAGSPRTLVDGRRQLWHPSPMLHRQRRHVDGQVLHVRRARGDDLTPLCPG
jgi:hypothetical protein